MNTRAKTAGRPAKVASITIDTAAQTEPQNGTAAPATVAVLSAPQPETRPLLDRLVPSILNGDIGAHQTQPQFGASVTVTVYPSLPKTAWLPAAAWEGVATLIRQTPDHCRPAVALFLTILHMDMAADDPLYGVLGEVISEVERDPYGEMPASDSKSFDFHWS
jgi:hypothetical protein